MPIETTHIEAGLHCTRWTGSISYQDMLDAQDAIRAHFDRQRTPQYVLIFDMSALAELPLTPRQTSRLIMPDDRMLRTVMVGASQRVRRISDTVSTIFKQTQAIEHDVTMEQAMARARQILQAHKART